MDHDRWRVVVAGATGKTGSAVTRVLLERDDIDIVAAVARRQAGQDLGTALGGPPTGILIKDDLEQVLETTPADVLVDFTVPDVVARHIETALEKSVPCVVGTTGLPRSRLEELGSLAERKGVALFVIANFSVGAMLLIRFAREAVRYMPQLELIEKHHAAKVDAPSGTAVRIAEALAEERGDDRFPIHSVRLPGLVAHHQVLFGGRDETLTLSHDTISREAFAPGVIMTIQVARRFTGLITDFETVFRAHEGS